MPNYYTPYYPQNYYQPQPIQPMQTPQVQAPQQAQPQIQNGGLVSVANESVARSYPVAIGTSVTFKDENAPYIYNKTMGFSQLESPTFDKYRLVKEETENQAPTPTETPDNTENIRDEISSIWKEIESIKKKLPAKATTRKKEEVTDDDE